MPEHVLLLALIGGCLLTFFFPLQTRTLVSSAAILLLSLPLERMCLLSAVSFLLLPIGRSHMTATTFPSLSPFVLSLGVLHDRPTESPYSCRNTFLSSSSFRSIAVCFVVLFSQHPAIRTIQKKRINLSAFDSQSYFLL